MLVLRTQVLLLLTGQLLKLQLKLLRIEVELLRLDVQPLLQNFRKCFGVGWMAFVCFSLVDEVVHVLVALLVGLIYFVIEEFGVVNAEAAVLGTDAHYFVDHVEAVARNFCLLELAFNHVGDLLVLACFQINEGRGQSLSGHLALFDFQVLVHAVFHLHEAVVVFVDDLVGASGTVAPREVH